MQRGRPFEAAAETQRELQLGPPRGDRHPEGLLHRADAVRNRLLMDAEGRRGGGSIVTAVAILVALLVTVTLLHRPPTRPCHRCGRRVRLERRICRHCGYDFEPVRFGR